MSGIPTSSVLDYAEEVARKMGVDPSLAKSIILAENMGKSGKIPEMLRSDLTSPKGAYGIAQVMKDTHEGLRNQGYLPKDHSLDSWQGQVEAGVAALKAKSKEHRTTDPIVLAAAYNGGNNGAKAAISGNFESLPTETKDYLNKLRIADNYLSTSTSTSRPSTSVPAGNTGVASRTGASMVRASENRMTGGVSSTPPDPSTVRDTRPPTPTLLSLEYGIGPEISGQPVDESTPQGRAAIALQKSVEQNRTILENLIKQTTDSTEEAAARMQGAAEALIVAGSFDGLAAEQKGALEAQTAGMRARVLNIANLNTTKVNNEFSRLLSERTQLQAARQPLREEIDARMSVGFFDNPLEYLVNATVLPGQVSQYNALVSRENDNVKALTQLQNDVKAQSEIDLGATADMFLKHSLALKDATVAKHRAEAEKLRGQASGLIAQRVINIASLRERMMHDQEMLERWRIALSDKRDASQLKDNERKEREDIDRRLQLVGNMIGREGVSIQSLKNQGKDVQEAWMTRQGTLTLGDNFAESFEFVRRFGDLNNMRLKGLAEFADMQRAFQQAVDAKANDVVNTWGQKHPELANKPPSMAAARRLAAEELETEWYGQRDNNMLGASPYNPYKVNHQKGAKVFSGNPQNVVHILVNDAFKNKLVVDDKIILKSVSSLVNAGTVTPREAALSLAEYYSFMIDKNNNDRSLRGMGLDKQETYIVRPDGFNGKVNLANPTTVENWLTYTVATEKARIDPFGEYYHSGSAHEATPFGPVRKKAPDDLSSTFKRPGAQ